MVYFVQKKNRCSGCNCVHYKSAYKCLATSSSQQTHTLAAKTAKNSVTSNRTKRGSGGNSYSGYLASRAGIVKCSSCNSKC